IRSETPNVLTPYSSNNTPDYSNHSPQPPTHSYENFGNNVHYGYDCSPQVPFIQSELCYNQDFNFSQNPQSLQQQFLCCNYCGGPHETFQCQQMNEDYYHEQNPCYDSNSFGFDQFQPPQYTVYHQILNSQNEFFNSQNEFFNSQNEQFKSGCEHLNTQMTTLHDLIAQAMQKKEEEKRIAEEQAAKERYWKIPICDDDDDNDYTIAITPVLSTEEPVNSLIMENEHLDTISATESDEFIKSSVEILVPIPSESKGVPKVSSGMKIPSLSNDVEYVEEHHHPNSEPLARRASSGSPLAHSDSSLSGYKLSTFDNDHKRKSSVASPGCRIVKLSVLVFIKVSHLQLQCESDDPRPYRLRSGYQQKDRKPSQNDKTEHGMEKTVQIKPKSKNAKVRVHTEVSAVNQKPK
ncbi:hypothetical protein Tco_0715306, partial [Tanacetum coccineum]